MVYPPLRWGGIFIEENDTILRTNSMIPFAWAAIGAGIVTTTIGGGVYIADRKDFVRKLFFFFCAGLGLWGTSLGLLLTTQNFFFNQFVFYAGFPIFAGLYLFTLAYPRTIHLDRWHYVAAVPSICIVALAYFDLFVTDMSRNNDGSLSPVNGPLMLLFLTMCAIYFAASIGILCSRFPKSRGHERLQLWYLLAAILLSAGSIVVFDIALPAANYSSFISLGPLSLVGFCALIAYAIVRYQLMDIRVVIQRGLIYSVLLALIVGFYAGLLHVIALVVNGGANSFIGGLVTIVVGIVTIPTIEQYFRRATDTFFFKNPYEYAEALRMLSEGLDRSLDFQTISDVTRERFLHILKPTFVSLLPGSMHCVGAQTLPVTSNGSVVGTLCLGPKRSGDLYTEQDKQLIQTFALHAATALARASLYEQVSKHALDLEAQVAERTQELRHAQENQTRLMLDLSHNLQTPLTVFQTKLETLKTALGDDAAVRSLEHSLEHVSRSISDLLALARLEQNPGEVFSTFDLSALLEDIVEEVDIIANDHGVALHSAIEPHVAISGIPKQIREALLALLSNALKYIGEAQDRHIWISLKTEGDTVVVSVRDTGIGIHPDDLPHIFERFWRADRGNSVAGTGLGLALAQQIAEIHNGSLTAKSNVEQGTTMTLQLPRA